MSVDFNELSIFRLSGGSHKNAEDGVCAMEAVAWLEGLPHSDRPKCTCPVIAAYVRNLNDYMSDDDRQQLVPYLPRLVGTVSKDHERERAEFFLREAAAICEPREGELLGHIKAVRTAKKHEEVCVAINAASSAAYAISWWSGGAGATGNDDWSYAFSVLNGALAIGPQSPGFGPQFTERLTAYREMVTA